VIEQHEEDEWYILNEKRVRRIEEWNAAKVQRLNAN